MSTITQIESALKAINQATFQSLINHLLYLQGNKFIGAPGAVVGKDKTSKGTPDSFFISNDKYVFVESTTQERLGGAKSFFEKLSKDVDHCFNENETKISAEKIQKIVLACTEKVSAEEYDLLNTKVKSYNPDVKFEILNIQNLPFLILDIPKLAKEYLNVETIKGDIFTLDQFILKTKRGIQPSLDNEFIGREEEIKNSIEDLKQYDILLLSGGAGVGKSKLAVKILEILSHENYIPIVIQSSGISLWDDYQHLFLPGKQYIILFDDANKSITNLKYLLSKLGSEQLYSAKVIITSRDYVKKQISIALSNHPYKEIVISKFKDADIEKIITTAQPDLKYYNDIKRKIIELSKGNARVALMAAYSVTPDAETNYLNDPVLLYEKYFQKISIEVEIFKNSIILKSLAIVSFFGVIDRNNEILKTILHDNFKIDWNELWSAILELHNHEILDVYSNEVVKVSDQVLATYAFYKCFIDEKSAVINYAEWIAIFMEKFPHRIQTTLIDINNTFVYHHVKDLVLPHLNRLLENINSDEKKYTFFTLFWFYKGRECLLYLKEWIATLAPELSSEPLKFTFKHNNHITPTKHFELLKNFWNHPNELLKPSIEFALVLLEKQPSRLSEVLKFIQEDFKYKINDMENGYLRQNILLDVLLDEDLPDIQKSVANGIFLMFAETSLGWHYTEFASGKGRAFTFYNFDLYKSEPLMKLRERILNQVYLLFDSKSEQVRQVLRKIIYPGATIDESIYADELPIYQKFISKKLNCNQYSDCEFVTTLASCFTKSGTPTPKNWDLFIESDIMKLSNFLNPDRRNRNGKSIQELEKEKQEKLGAFVESNNWENIKKFLFTVSNFFQQQTDGNAWHVENAITNLYMSIAKKDKVEFENALKLFFNGGVSFPLRTTVLNFALQNNCITGVELLNIMNKYDFQQKPYWVSVLLAMLPDDQVDILFLNLLIEIFKNPESNIYLHRMLDYLKYERVFEEFKKGNSELENHNIITYLTSIRLSNTSKMPYRFGFGFCVDCAKYFTKHPAIFKAVYLIQKETEQYFDNDGQELEAVLKLDSNFLIELLEQQAVNEEYLTFKLEDFKLDYIWQLPNYEDLVGKALDIIIAKSSFFSNWDHPATALFTFKQISEELQEKALQFLDKYLAVNIENREKVLIVFNIIMHRFNKYFIDFIRKFLVKVKDIEIFKSIHLDMGGVYSGSRVPHIQREINFCSNLIKMINELPDTLSYTAHIGYLEQKVIWLKKDIDREQKREFEDEYY